MRYLVKTLPVLYNKIVLKFSVSDQDRFYKLIKQVEENPYVGDALQIKSIREKRFNGRRIFVIFEDLKAVLIVAISDKKNQQKVIDFIRDNLNEYRALIKKILDEQD